MLCLKFYPSTHTSVSVFLFPSVKPSIDLPYPFYLPILSFLISEPSSFTFKSPPFLLHPPILLSPLLFPRKPISFTLSSFHFSFYPLLTSLFPFSSPSSFHFQTILLSLPQNHFLQSTPSPPFYPLPLFHLVII